jgi:transposase InsO family protein
VARIMKENKVSPLLRRRRKPVTTVSNHKLKSSPNLLEQKFHCQVPNAVWLADITYIYTDEGWLWFCRKFLRSLVCCPILRHGS